MSAATSKLKELNTQSDYLTTSLYGCETWSLKRVKNTYRARLTIGCLGEYLDLRGTKAFKVGENEQSGDQYVMLVRY
jgi:hypothetical protein